MWNRVIKFLHVEVGSLFEHQKQLMQCPGYLFFSFAFWNYVSYPFFAK